MKLIFLYIAYTIAWGGILIYLVYLHKKIGRTE
jgi:CcmD family protein